MCLRKTRFCHLVGTKLAFFMDDIETIFFLSAIVVIWGMSTAG
jgi:hypothetical protein